MGGIEVGKALWAHVVPPAARRHLTGPAARLRARFVRRPKPWEEIAYVVGSAVAISIALDALVAPPETALALLGRVLGSLVRIAVAVAFGMWLGKRVWPRRGLQLGRALLRRATHGRVRPVLYLTDRPDFEPRTARRVFEVVAFSASATILLATMLALAGASRIGLSLPSNIFIAFTLWAGFLLVPYWTFARMGIRRVDPVRWTVEPFGRRYAQRLRLSNGAILLLALTVAVNVVFRSASGNEALLGALRLMGHLAAAAIVAGAAAVAYYNRAERGVFLELEKKALAEGIRDGRGMSDGDFLPRL